MLSSVSSAQSALRHRARRLRRARRLIRDHRDTFHSSGYTCGSESVGGRGRLAGRLRRSWRRLAVALEEGVDLLRAETKSLANTVSRKLAAPDEPVDEIAGYPEQPGRLVQRHKRRPRLGVTCRSVSSMHADSVAATTESEKTGDHELRQACPILFDQCAPSIRRLDRFNEEQWLPDDGPVRRYRTEGTVDRDGLDEHARMLLGCVLDELAAFGVGARLTHAEAFELSRARKKALEALARLGRRAPNDPKGYRHAKAVQAALASPGVPLAICTGSSYTRQFGGRRFRPVGCFAIFEDAPFSRGNMWPTWCPDCRPKNGVRNPARDQARAHARWLKRRRIDRGVGLRAVAGPTPP